jgi:uncharacterized protein (DUF2141 family)
MKRLLTAAALLAAACPAWADSVRPRQDLDWRRGRNCSAGSGPGFAIQIVGLRDRTGRLMAELYPAEQNDFLKGEEELRREGKVFRRAIAVPSSQGPVTLCIDAPAPGRYALLVVHDRDGRMKFDIWKDGVGVAGSDRLGMRRPTAAQAMVSASPNRRPLLMSMQYMRGGSGFGPAGAPVHSR